MYQGTQLDGLSAGDTIRLNGYIPCLTELYRAYHCSLSTFHHGRSINLAAANAETVEIGVCSRFRVFINRKPGLRMINTRSLGQTPISTVSALAAARLMERP